MKRMRHFLLQKGFPQHDMLVADPRGNHISRSKSHRLISTQVLTDDQRGAGRPTKETMRKALDWLVRDAKRGDALFFHYSGYGGQEDDPEGIEDDGFNETIIP